VNDSGRLRRSLWNLVWLLLYRPSPTPLHGWRRMLLRLFGAAIGEGAHPYPSARIWAPWNLEMGEGSCLAPGVDCYSVHRVTLGDRAIVSQRASLCSATHDHNDPAFPLVTAPIAIEADAWVAAEAFIGPGVTVGRGAVVGARAVVMRDVAGWTVVAGNPARKISDRNLQS
jgi:putative colanic acid biosynthesis acetyltransferase WcaF